MKNVKSQLLIVGFYSDWLYPPERGKEIQMAAMDNNINSSYIVLEGAHGHDSFLFSSEEYSKAIRKFIES
jgi:homoserine O-acetyltransferase